MGRSARSAQSTARSTSNIFRKCSTIQDDSCDFSRSLKRESVRGQTEGSLRRLGLNNVNVQQNRTLRQPGVTGAVVRMSIDGPNKLCPGRPPGTCSRPIHDTMRADSTHRARSSNRTGKGHRYGTQAHTSARRGVGALHLEFLMQPVRAGRGRSGSATNLRMAAAVSGGRRDPEQRRGCGNGGRHPGQRLRLMPEQLRVADPVDQPDSGNRHASGRGHHTDNERLRARRYRDGAGVRPHGTDDRRPSDQVRGPVRLDLGELGSGASRSGSYWKPVAPDGCCPLGSVGVARRSNPSNNGAATVLSAFPGSAALSAPLDYQHICNDAGSGANDDGPYWLPQCPSGYVACSVVAQFGHSKPGLDEVRCARSDLVANGKVGSLV